MEEKKKEENKEAKPPVQTTAEKQLDFEKLSKDYTFVKKQADEYYEEASLCQQKASVFDSVNAIVIVPRLTKLREEIEADNLKKRVDETK